MTSFVSPASHAEVAISPGGSFREMGRVTAVIASSHGALGGGRCGAGGRAGRPHTARAQRHFGEGAGAPLFPRFRSSRELC